MRDGGFNCRSAVIGSVCFTKHISSARACECGDEVNALFLSEVRQPFILDPMSAKESSPPIKAPNLLLVGGGGESSLVVDEGLRDESHEVISLGSWDILKFDGICEGKRVV